jgi:hypothetical protein
MSRRRAPIESATLGEAGEATPGAILGVPMLEIELVSEALNDFDLAQQQQFGDLVNAAIVRNFKAAQLKNRPVSIRGLARVIGIQPSTLRRRIAQLVERGWLERDGEEVRYAAKSYQYGAPASHTAVLRFAQVLKQLGWGDFRPPRD